MLCTNIESKRKKRNYRPERLEYLNQLVVEFQSTNSGDAKQQVLANLANFAYDPLNYEHFRQLNILDLFLDNLLSQEENLVKFSIGGLCNLCLDSVNKSRILKNGLESIIKLLEHKNHDILLSTLTTLIYLITSESKEVKLEITSRLVIKLVLKISKVKNSRIQNLTSIFLNDYCTQEQIKEATSVCDTDMISTSSAADS